MTSRGSDIQYRRPLKHDVAGSSALRRCPWRRLASGPAPLPVARPVPVGSWVQVRALLIDCAAALFLNSWLRLAQLSVEEIWAALCRKVDLFASEPNERACLSSSESFVSSGSFEVRTNVYSTVPIVLSCGFTNFQLIRSVVYDSATPCTVQHARPPCPSPTPGVYSNPCPLNGWCQPTVSSSVVPFSSSLQSFPASGSFQMSQFFTSGGQSTGVSASVLPMNILYWPLLGCTGWISLQSKAVSRSSPTTQFKSINSLVLSFLGSPTLTSIHDYWKNHSFD